ncbi:hypothetical protein ABB37_06686 [Leptomonas pyrrhocoris]|uniref:Uncharacterized protein n=1 Tax=Leptomonas pyrrhocoris TaxID=157538 RepID=A0A0M9FX46_LEPPY|nr:hypothetical protein ABB37_06686 [Leptomonas pyrrhocoris]KPA77900.1 hypothetical protein ABB37_06686 [Leptomonas pyrrhocoris]|eukprot:XP_015656339.1 hypothetical protein ABB37_06686 [Leptomonas pyrrhocoris]
MKIKKKELRKREAQLPINYPDPDVLPESLPGGAIDLEVEMVQVEILCKRLAHNEVVVRDAVLAELPHYLERLTTAMRAMEKNYEAEIAEVQAYFKAHRRAPNPYHYENLPLALQVFREKAVGQERENRRKQSLRELRHQQAEARRENDQYGRFGKAAGDADGESDEEDSNAGLNWGPRPPHEYKGENMHRERYQVWMEAWCDLELVFLKLARGIHYCMWHSDKPLVQLACAQKIADLLYAPQTTRCKVLFYGALFRVLAREWSTIDRYRMDKYLALVRRMVFAYVKLVREIHEEEVAALATRGASSAKDDKEIGDAQPPPTKKGKAAGKRSRDGATTAAAAETTAEAEASSETDDNTSANWKVSHGIPHAAVKKYLGNATHTAEIVEEIFFILQRQIFVNTASIGMTMHICDVVFDELVRAATGVDLFLALAAGIPLYAMSQGNYVEKRVLDNFFPPIAGGVYAQRRAEQLAQTMAAAVATAGAGKKAVGSSGKARSSAAATAEALEAKATAQATAEANTIMLEVAFCCRKYAVARGIAHEVRPMFSEAELILRQSADPDSFQEVSFSGQRRRIERELADVDGIRGKVRSERQAVRDMKKQNRNTEMRQKVKARKAALIAEGGEKTGITNAELRKKIVSEETRAKRKPVHNTKRKKAYHLTKQDLYGDADPASKSY